MTTLHRREMMRNDASELLGEEMKLENLLSALGQRAPWLAAGRPLLLRSGFSIHRGYERTFSEALKEPCDSTRLETLRGILTEYSVVGEKALQIIRVGPREREQVKSWISAKRTSTSPLVARFPELADVDVLRLSVTSEPVSLGCISLASGTAALYSSARSYLSSVELNPSDLKVERLGGIEKLVAMRRVYRQTFDAAWIPDGLDVVCLIADQPSEAPSGFANPSLTALRNQIRQVLGQPIEVLNLWPAVAGLYKAADGRLVDYGFATDEESVKRHRARRGAACLRTAIYDKAGADAVGDSLVPFRVAMQWKIDRGHHERPTPELLLPGVAALLQKSSPCLDLAVVRCCLDSRDMAFVVAKLLPFLK